MTTARQFLKEFSEGDQEDIGKLSDQIAGLQQRKKDTKDSVEKARLSLQIANLNKDKQGLKTDAKEEALAGLTLDIPAEIEAKILAKAAGSKSLPFSLLLDLVDEYEGRVDKDYLLNVILGYARRHGFDTSI